MKKLYPVLFAGLLLCACSAAPDTTPLATPTPEPSVAAEPTPAPSGEFYALDRLQSAFNSGDAYYEFHPQFASCLLLKTDYATAEQTVCCAIPGCTHDTEDCPAYFPGRHYYVPFVAQGQLYVLNAPLFTEEGDMTWEDFYAQYVVPRMENSGETFDGMSEQEIENYYHSLWQQQTTAMRLYTVNPAGGNTYLDLPKECREAVFDYCDGTSLYGMKTSGAQGQNTEIIRFSIADGSMETLPLEQTESWKGVYDGALLTMRYVTDAPLPDDWEQYMAAIQSATVEFDRYDPRTGERRKLAERPYYEKNIFDNDFAGTHNGKLYFSDWITDPQSGTEQNRLIQCDPADGSTVTIWDTTPGKNLHMSYDYTNDLPPCDHSTERWIWLSGSSGWSEDVFALLDTETFAIIPVEQKIKNDPDGWDVYRIAQTSDSRWLIVTETTENGSAYGLIAPEDLIAGSTDPTPVTMWQ